jgi:UDP:flavonoid glycosyltransferase YjiC (YdhE family)
VLFVAPIEHGGLLQTHGLPHVRVTNTGSPYPFLYQGAWYQEADNHEQVAVLRPIMDAAQPAAIVTSPLTLSALILAEERGLPTVVLGFAEYLFPGVDGHPARKAWRLRDMSGHLNRVRQSFGLGPASDTPEGTPLLGSVYLHRDVPDASDPAFPEQVIRIGAALCWHPSGVNHRLSAFVAETRRRGLPLAYVQIGRLFGGSALWQRFVREASSLPICFAVDVGRHDYLDGSPAHPPNFFVDDYIPLEAVAQDAFCVISSAQTGSYLSAILAGLPMLCVPYADDAKELTARVGARGLGMGVLDVEAQPDGALGAALERLRVDAGFRASVARWRQAFIEHGDERRLVDEIIRRVGRRRGAASGHDGGRPHTPGDAPCDRGTDAPWR